MSTIKYLPTHEYARVEGNIAFIGISPFAAKQLGNVVYVDMPEADDEVTAGEDFGAIESVKAASDLYSPVSGTVIEANEELADNPKLVNDDPLTHWIIKVEMSNPAELDSLLDEAAYAKLCAEEEH
jgi:glycine cleavage system H protein